MKRSPTKRKRAGLSVSQRKELDRMHRDVVMIRHGAVPMDEVEGRRAGWYGPCLKCEKLRYLQVSHIHPKGRCPNARWIPENAFALCGGCHKFWWHNYPDQAVAFTLDRLGEEGADLLRIACQTAGRPDYYLTRFYLEQQLKGMNA